MTMDAIIRLMPLAAFFMPMSGFADLPAVVQKPSVDVYAQPSFDAPRLKTLKRGDAVSIAAQLGLWYELPVSPDAPGYVRVNDVRVVAAGGADGDETLRVLMGEKAGRGRVTETAGVRGIDESDLRSASLNQAQLDAMVAQRVDAPAGASYAAEHGWQAVPLAYAAEPQPAKGGATDPQKTIKRSDAVKAVGGLLGALGSDLGTKLSNSEKVIPKGQGELAAEELALGPEITGRILGARPLWNDAGAQRRVNLVGRWVASQTSRPELPWTFGVIDDPEVNAFAAPGGYVLVTRGLYELLSNDAELAAVLGHEIGHCVQRDHYKVIYKQEMAATGKQFAMSRTGAATGSAAADFARRYAEENGAAIMLTSLDREAEYRADEAAQFYLVRAGLNPLALYSVMQKLAALGPESAGLAQLYRTHPPFEARIDRLDQRSDGPLAPYAQRD
jgi:Zn-dependent protease with chaperone function